MFGREYVTLDPKPQALSAKPKPCLVGSMYALSPPERCIVGHLSVDQQAFSPSGACFGVSEFRGMRRDCLCIVHFPGGEQMTDCRGHRLFAAGKYSTGYGCAGSSEALVEPFAA
jgi:hypothetical protein